MLRPPLRSLSSRLTAVVVLTVLVIGGGSFWILQDYYRRQMIASLAESTAIEGKLVEQSLRHAMHSRSLDHLGEMVRRLADQKSVENVMILNKKGVIRFSSDPADRGRVLSLSDPTCKICHRHGPSVRGRTVTFETHDGHRVFRNVNPILNSDACHECHSPDDRVNGVLIVDYSMAGIDASLSASTRKMWLSAVTLSVAIIAVIMIVMRRLVLRRLASLVTVVDSIEAGDLDRSASVRGADEIDRLGDHLNRMTRSLDHTLRRLREREAFLDAVIHSAADGIVVVDEDLNVVTANEAFERLGGTESPLAGRCDCAGLCSGEDLADCPARSTFSTGAVTRRVRTLGGDGDDPRHFEISASPLNTASGRRQVIEIWRDITQRREIEAHLASQERLASLGLLASGISHEINNPLASITTCLDGLRRRLRDAESRQIPDELPEYLDLIRGEVGRCQRLTERLKLLGRNPRPHREPVDVGAVVRDTLALLRYECRKGRVDVVERVATEACIVLADQAKIRQVVLNVLLNAVQSMDGPGRLVVRVESTEDAFVRVEVTDTGRGIEPAALSKVFEPFYSARSDGKGTGLGLFISKIIVDGLGGSIRVSSAPGEGAAFTILLPAAPRAAEEVRS